MDAVTPIPLRGGQTADLSVFDLAYWRPISPERYVAAFAGIAYALDEGQPIATEVQDLPDGRVRTVTYAPVRDLDKKTNRGVGEATMRPYLLSLFEPDEGPEGKSLTFRRSGVELDDRD